MLTALLILSVVLFLILVIPVGAEILCEESGHRFRFLYAGIRFPIDTAQRSTKKKTPKKTEPSNVSETIEQFHAVNETFFRLWELYEGRMFKKLFRVLGRFRRALHFRVHYLYLAVGTPDPALTGMLYGAACLAAAALPRKIPLELFPDFVGKETKIRYRLSMTIIPLQILFEIIRNAIYLRLWSVWRLKREIWSQVHIRRQHV